MPSPIFILLKRLRYPLILLICIYAVLILGFTLIPGKDGQGNLWHMSFFHAFYFVSFMGSTIGFGEIPYPFTDAQRLWTILGIFSSVIAWIYSIGTLLSIIKEPAFQRVLTETSFEHSVKNLKTPFYLICGYGDTGSMLSHGLAKLSIQSVVIDIKQIRIDFLDIEEPDMDIPGLCANAVFPENLILAGLTHPLCEGVIALTNEDQVNLKIAITSKLLNKNIQVISRADTREIMKNMASFDTNHIINPYEMFARRLALAIRSPGAYLLYDWFTNSQTNLLEEPPSPPTGYWLVCGYGRFGKAVSRFLEYEGIRTIIIEANPEKTSAPQGAIKGNGTESITLKEAGISHASGIVAGTDNDSNNLSIIMTAKEINKNKELYCVARQNFQGNGIVFNAADLDLVMQPASILAREILAIIRTPLLSEFLSLVRKQKNSWVNLVISRISALYDKELPSTWTIKISELHSTSIKAIVHKGQLNIGDLMRNPRDREKQLCCMPLLIKYKSKKHKLNLLPESDYKLLLGDEILFCGDINSQYLMQWTVNNINTLQYVIYGEEYNQGYVWNRLFGAKKTQPAK
ncbi:MAG: NAD-binding protein [Pseudomonadota bacterium]